MFWFPCYQIFLGILKFIFYTLFAQTFIGQNIILKLFFFLLDSVCFLEPIFQSSLPAIFHKLSNTMRIGLDRGKSVKSAKSFPPIALKRHIIERRIKHKIGSKIFFSTLCNIHNPTYAYLTYVLHLASQKNGLE